MTCTPVNRMVVAGSVSLSSTFPSPLSRFLNKRVKNKQRGKSLSGLFFFFARSIVEWRIGGAENFMERKVRFGQGG